MKKKTTRRSPSKRRLAHETEGAAAGAIAAIAIGVAAGPPGALAGAVIGAAVGAIAAAALDTLAPESARTERRLDEETGVMGGEIGAPNLKHPPANVGAYSSASVGGASSSGSTPAEGPISGPE